MLIHFPPVLNKEQDKYLRRNIEDWALSNGLCMQEKDDPARAVHAPVTLFPTPFSKSGFEEALSIQKAFNELYHGVVCNPDWLLKALEPLLQYDEFTQRLVELHRRTSVTRTQPLTGGLFRSDYLVNRVRTNDVGRQIKQVEFNTISVSFGALATRVTQMHRFLANTARNIVHGEIPRNSALEDLSRGLANMHAAYHVGDKSPTTSSSVSAILFIVQPEETNVMDQRLIEYELANEHGILCYRVPLSDVKKKLSIQQDNNKLIFTPTGREISVVYYRAGYSPDDYPSDAEWEGREMLERSHAIQCPAIITQLAGSKKIQQLLTTREAIATVAPQLEPGVVDRLLKTFVNIYPLDDSELGLQGQHLALEDPELFVLKPQREGGGNNIYGADIPAFLQSIPKNSWGAYILMEMIEPPKISNRILRASEAHSGRVVNELGVFGTVLWDLNHGENLLNEQAGWLLRTKLQESNEGGIAAGFGCLDSVQLPGAARDES